jgi:CMP-N-acetylneuraminic acid synthetase
MKVLAVIPARCGSKGFPDKNIAKINNTTLLELAVQIGLDCKYIDDVYVSTDCVEYEKIAINAGALSLGLRLRQLSTDIAKSIDVVIDVIKNIKIDYDYVVLLQPTSPVRSPNDIINMIKLIGIKSADAAVSVCKFEEPHPYKLKSINDNNGFISSFMRGTSSETPRQLLPKIYALNGAIYVVKVDILLKEKTFLPQKTVPYIMKNNINIDSEEDFIFLEAMHVRDKINLWGLDD